MKNIDNKKPYNVSFTEEEIDILIVLLEERVHFIQEIWEGRFRNSHINEINMMVEIGNRLHMLRGGMPDDLFKGGLK